MEGFSYADGAYQLRAVIADNAGNTYTTTPVDTTIDNTAPANTTPPTVSGTLWTGRRLKASVGFWAGTGPFTYAYQWKRCDLAGTSCSAISGATSSSYLLGEDDVGGTLRVTVTATNPLDSASSTSEATGVVAATPCTDSWTGPSEGSWQTPANWSADVVPGPFDVTCIESGNIVQMTDGTNQTGVLLDEGALDMSGGSLELANALEPSSVSTLTLENTILTGPGTLAVTASLSWQREATMSGSGKTVLDPGASASLLTVGDAACAGAKIAERTLVNEGTINLGNTSSTGGSLVMSEGARLENAGVLNDNSGAWDCSPWEGTIVEGAETKTAPSIINTGTFEETESNSPSFTTKIDVPFENEGTFDGKSGGLGFESVPVTLRSSSVLKGSIGLVGADVTAGSILGAGADVTLSGSAIFSVASDDTASIGRLSFEDATVTGAGTLNILSSMLWENGGTFAGTGKTVLEGGAKGEILEGIYWCEGAQIKERTFVNDGTVTFSRNSFGSTMGMSDGAKLDNNGVFIDNSDGMQCGPWLGTILGGRSVKIVNAGTFERTNGWGEGAFITSVSVPFESWGRTAGEISFLDPVGGGSSAWGCSDENPSFPKREIASEEGVCTASGDLSEAQTDFAIGGRGVGLKLTRTYNSQAAEERVKGVFGYGWSSPYRDHLTVERVPEEEAETEVNVATLVQENGSTVEFTEGSGGTWIGPEGSPDVLYGSDAEGYTVTFEDQDVYKFAGSSGRLEAITDRNGNMSTLSYNGDGELEKVTDSAGRSLNFTYNVEGLVEAATDPMGHVVKYAYQDGNLISVSQPGEAALRWQLKYEGASQLSEVVDGRGGSTTYKYSEAHRLIAKTDPMGRTTSFEYGDEFTKITNEATKAVTVEYLTTSGQLVEAVHGAGTSSATTEAFTYDTAGDETSVTDGDGYTTKYEYDPDGDRILMEDPEGHRTKWTYDSKHDVISETTPDGETTTIDRNSAGEPETILRPAPGGETQATKYTYDSDGDETSMEDPLKRIWKYEYDAAGDRIAEIDPEGNKRSWVYDENSVETAMVSPRGHVTGADEALFTTTTERDAQGRPIRVIAPLKDETAYKYDGDGNVESETDAEGNTTAYTYNADNEKTQAREADGTLTETGYDGAGEVTSQTDGDRQTTTYVRNVLEQVIEVVDPLGRKTVKEYDASGNPIRVTDAEKRVTSYKYDPDNHLIQVSYSDGTTPTVKYEYNGDGDRTRMTDGTGTTTYEYDELGRLIATKDGHGDIVGYEYNLANEQTKITYPSGKAVTRTYDDAGRLKSVTDWLGDSTKFTYNASSDLTATVFPTETGDEDNYAYDEGDAVSEVRMSKDSEALASIVYTRNKNAQVTKAISKGLPGAEELSYSYDKSNRLTEGAGTGYSYDEANNPTTSGSDTDTYNVGDELEKSTHENEVVATYTYNEIGERTKAAPTSGASTAYGYDEAGNLTAVTRAKDGETPAVEDTYAYNGDGLRTAQTISGTTGFLTWDTSEELPLLMSDGTNSYIYGPAGLPFEQINNTTGAVLYLHHDQQGSTRLLTGSTGKTEATYTYDAYGNKTGSTGTSTTPMGYDGQYTSSDTGLIYLRARGYDPATAQFLSVDPKAEETNAVYGYAADNPLTNRDPTGTEPLGEGILGPQELLVEAAGLRVQSAVFYGGSAVLEAALKDAAKLVGVAPEQYAEFLLKQAVYFEKVAETLEHRKPGAADAYYLADSGIEVDGHGFPTVFKTRVCVVSRFEQERCRVVLVREVWVEVESVPKCALGSEVESLAASAVCVDCWPALREPVE